MLNFNVSEQLQRINKAFKAATRGMGSNVKGTNLHRFQSEMAYIIDGIERGPVYAIPHLIHQGDELIKAVNKFNAEKQEKAKK